MVGQDSHEVSRVSCYLGLRTVLTNALRLQDFHLLRLAVPSHSAVHLLCNKTTSLQGCPSGTRYPPHKTLAGYNCAEFGLFPFRSPLLRESLRFLFLGVLRCFTSPGIAFHSYEFRMKLCGITRIGFPHSEIFGSKRVCSSPKHYRSLPRPSSPCSAKSSTIRST